jgi:hypothetical protein
MAALANVSELIHRGSGGSSGTPENVPWHKAMTTTFVAGVWASTWLEPGSPGPGSAPGAAAIPTNATAGAVRMTNPGGGRQRWFRYFAAGGHGAARLLFYDRLLHSSGLSGTSTSAQAVGTSVTRYTGADSFGTLMFAEIYTQIGNTPTTLSVTYKDSTGTNRTSPSVVFGGPNARNVGAMVQIPFSTTTGHNSVTQVVDATLAASTGTAGDWGITILRPLMRGSIPPASSAALGVATKRMALEDVEFKTDACLGIAFMPLVTSNVQIYGQFYSVER